MLRTVHINRRASRDLGELTVIGVLALSTVKEKRSKFYWKTGDGCWKLTNLGLESSVLELFWILRYQCELNDVT